MKPIRSFVKRNSFAVFVALAFLLSWCLLALGLLLVTRLNLGRKPALQAEARA